MISSKYICSVASFVALVLFLCAQRISAQTQIHSISFVDEAHGWLSLTKPSPAIFRTSDGGRSWIRMPHNVKWGFYLIRFLDENIGIGIQSASGNETAIYRTVDGGRSWTKVNSIDGQYLTIDDLKFTGKDKALLVGERTLGRGWVAELTNEGRTLHLRDDLPVDFTQQSNTLGILDDGNKNLWIVGKELILHSADDGSTWENQARNATPAIDLGMNGSALPGGSAWIAVANFQIYRTQDYGRQWVRTLTTADKGDITFYSLSFFDKNDGCAVGNSAFIYCTADGGISWRRARVFKNFPKDSQLQPASALFLFQSLQGWASVNGSLYKTEDGGKSFKEIVLPLK